MWVVYFHFCDNWSHVRFTQLCTNRWICLKYIPGLWYRHSTFSCVTWTSQGLQRWTESLQTYLRQDVASLWLAVFEIERHNFTTLSDSLWHMNQHKAGIQHIKQPFPKVKLFQQSMVFLSNCCRKNQKNPQIWQKCHDLPGSFPQHWSFLQSRGADTEQHLQSHNSPSCQASPACAEEHRQFQPGLFPSAAPLLFLGQSNAQGQRGERKQSNGTTQHSLAERTLPARCCGKGQKGTWQEHFWRLCTYFYVINIYLCFWIESIQVTKLEILVYTLP